MKVLGIHDGHNASACLIENGELLFAIQEERLVYEKNKGGFPARSVRFILQHFKLAPHDIDAVAMASTHTSMEFESTSSKISPSLKAVVKRTPLYSLYRKNRRKERLENLKKAGFTRGIFFVDHHACHAATAYFGSHFPRSEKVLVLTNDGAGDGLCATVSVGGQGTLQKIAEIKSTDSLAGIYCLVTKMLGFKPLEHEYKLMGMAPYCSEKETQAGYELFRDLVRISPSNPLLFERTVAHLPAVLEERFRFVRFDTICAGLQKFTEEILVQWVRNCIQKTGVRNIALAGGIFMNVKANKRIMELPEVEDMFVFPSCGDETVSLGAAYQVYEKLQGSGTIKPLSHFYLGNSFSDMEALQELQKSQFSYHLSENIEREVALLLAEKMVVARCKGNMEFGARALGNRSILADPSDLCCLREINMMVKKRDFWMPFAPVMLQESATKYIVNPKNISAPYMILSFDTTEKYPEMMAAVHQADLTARPQVISKEMNEGYYTILSEFEKKTGRGVLLNTSFNLHGFPIVNGPGEALDVFQNSGLKYLALGNYLVTKH